MKLIVFSKYILNIKYVLGQHWRSVKSKQMEELSCHNTSAMRCDEPWTL